MEESPLHPFELHELIPISLFGLDISINKAVILMWIVVGLAGTLLVVGGSARKMVPTKLQSLAELLVDFIRGIILDTMGKDGMKFFPLVATLFVFILFCNVLGLIPGSYTVTSQIIVTGVFAVSVYALSVALGFLLHGVKFLGILIPPGTPGWLLPLMIPIELVSQLARPVSLAVRLFANMTAGHVMMKVFGGFVVAMGVFGIVPLVFIVALTGLEILIACLQAYVFAVLTCIYLNDALHMEH